MSQKIGLIIGLAVGYVLGARAGRARYEQIRGAVLRVRELPVIASPLDTLSVRVSDAVRAQGERLTDAAADAVRDRLSGPATATGSSGEQDPAGS